MKNKNWYSILQREIIIAILVAIDIYFGSFFITYLIEKLNTGINRIYILIFAYVFLFLFSMQFISSIRKAFDLIFNTKKYSNVITIHFLIGLLCYSVNFISSYNGVVLWAANATDKVNVIDYTFEQKAVKINAYYDSLIRRHQKTYDSLINNKSKFTAINEFERNQILYNQKIRENKLNDLSEKFNGKINDNKQFIEVSKSEYRYVAYVLFILLLIFNIFDVYLLNYDKKNKVVESKVENKELTGIDFNTIEHSNGISAVNMNEITNIAEKKLQFDNEYDKLTDFKNAAKEYIDKKHKKTLIEKYSSVAECIQTIDGWQTMPMQTLQIKVAEKIVDAPKYITTDKIRREILNKNI